MTVVTPLGCLTVRGDNGGAADRGFLSRLFSAVKAAEMARVPVPAAMRRTLTAFQHQSMTQTYARLFPHARSEIIELDAIPVGRILTDVTADRLLFVDLAMLPDVQGRGLATAVMSALLEEPRRRAIPAQAQVLATNVASLRLCARLGFVRRAEEFPNVLLEWHG